MEISQEMLLSLAGAVTVVGGAWITVRKIMKDNKQEKAETAATILQAAKEDISVRNTLLDVKIKEANQRIDNLEESIEKDLAHLRENFDGELRNLGTKIEELRKQLSDQHGSLVNLLTRLIGSGKE